MIETIGLAIAVGIAGALCIVITGGSFVLAIAWVIAVIRG